MILLPILTALCLFAAAWAVGGAIVCLADRRRALAPGAAALFAIGLGLGLLAHLALLFGLIGRARVTGWLLAAALLLALPRAARTVFAAIASRWRLARAWRPDAVSAILAVLLAAAALAALLAALTPPFLYDTLEYHLAGPLRWLRIGRVGAFPGNVYANMPCEAEMLYMAAMSALAPAPAWLAQRAPGIMHWLFGAGALAAMWAIMRRLETLAPVRWLALLLVALHPVFFRTTYDAYVDFAVMFWVGLALLAWLEWRATFRPIFGALFFVFLGLALCAKLTVATLYLAPALLILTPWRNGGRVFLPADSDDAPSRRTGMSALRWWLSALRWPLAGLALVAIVYLPWLLRAWLATGNPFFPALCSLFPTPHWSAEQTGAFLRYHGQTFPWRWEYWRSLVERLWQPGLWIALPCAMALFARSRAIVQCGGRALAWWAVAAYAVWCLALQSADRFLLPALMAAAPVSAAVLSDAIARRRWLVVALWSLLALLAAPSSATFGRIAGGWPIQPGPGVVDMLVEWIGARPWRALPGETAGRLWQAQAVSPPSAARAAARVNEQLPANARLLLVFEARFALFDRDVAGNTVFDRSALIEALQGEPVTSAADVRSALRRKGFTHVLINDNDLLLFIRLFTRGQYERARDAALASQGAPPAPEDFHLPFLNDPRYPPLRKPLLQFLRESRENAVFVESDSPTAPGIFVDRL